MGRHTGQKRRRDGSPTQKMKHSPIGTVGLGWTEPRRNRRVEAMVGSIWMRDMERVRLMRSMREVALSARKAA